MKSILSVRATLINPLTTNVFHHVETSQLICIPTQLTGFYMMGNIRRYWVNGIFAFQKESTSTK